jgi:hypothetical protein
LSDAGISVSLPPGWDGQIRAAGQSRARRTQADEDEGTTGFGSVLHAASFALPAERGDYGSGAVERMGGSDVLVCLLEHPPEDANAPLFERVGVPMLSNAQFSPQTMQRAVPGAAGSQHFFQVGGRPFCLYVVIGSFRTRGPLVRAANEVVRSIRVAAR